MIPAMLLVLAFPLHASSLRLERLLEHVAPVDGTMERTYRQTRESSMLTESASVEGTIRYRYPGYLHKSESGTEDARTVIVDGDTVHVERDGERSTFPLDRYRVLEALMFLLDAMAQADADRLREHFRIELEGDIEEWRLLLESRTAGGNGSDRGMQQQGGIELELFGRDDRIRRIVLVSSGSGRMMLEFGDEGH